MRVFVTVFVRGTDTEDAVTALAEREKLLLLRYSKYMQLVRERYPKATDQAVQALGYEELISAVDEALRVGIDFLIYASNTDPQRRRNLVSRCRLRGAEVIALQFVPIGLAESERRGSQVQWHNLATRPPSLDEGFTEVHTIPSIPA